MSKNIGKIIRVNSLPPKGERLTNVIYQVAVPETATYIDYAVDENGDIKTPTLDKSLADNDFSKVKTVNNEVPDEQGNIDVNDYVQIYNSEEELQEIWDNGIRDKIYFNHQTKDMVIGHSDGDAYSLFKMDEYLDKPITTGTDQEHPYVVVVDNEGNSAKRDLEDFGKIKTVNNQEPDENGNIKIEEEFVKNGNGWSYKYAKDNPLFYGEQGEYSINLSFTNNENTEEDYKFGSIGKYSVAMGLNSSAMGKSSFVSGESNKSSGDYNHIISFGSKIIETSGFTEEGEKNANGIFGGGENIIKDNYGSATLGGWNNSIIGIREPKFVNNYSHDNVIVGGYENTLDVDPSNTNAVIRACAIVGGRKNKGQGFYQLISGAYNEAVTMGETIVGVYSTIQDKTISNRDYVPTARMFNVGIGYWKGYNQDVIQKRQDGLSVFWNGLVTAPTSSISLINSNNKSLVTKEYIDNRISSLSTIDLSNYYNRIETDNLIDNKTEFVKSGNGWSLKPYKDNGNTGLNSINFGYESSKNTGERSMIFGGRGVTVSGIASVSIGGDSNNISSSSSLAIGNNNISGGDNNYVLGYGSRVTGQGNFIHTNDEHVTVTGNKNTLFGADRVTVNSGGNNNVIVGGSGITTGIGSSNNTIIGGTSTNIGTKGDNIIIGVQNKTDFQKAKILGDNNTASNDSEIILGTAATDVKYTSNDNVLKVGMGTLSETTGSVTERKDALIVDKSGLAYLPTSTKELIEASSKGTTIVTKDYLTDKINNLPIPSGNYIPLTGTESGKNLTGSIEVASDNSIPIFKSGKSSISFKENELATKLIFDYNQGNLNLGSYTISDYSSGAGNEKIYTRKAGDIIDFTSFKQSVDEFSSNIDLSTKSSFNNLSFVQKSYVDKSIEKQITFKDVTDNYLVENFNSRELIIEANIRGQSDNPAVNIPLFTNSKGKKVTIVNSTSKTEEYSSIEIYSDGSVLLGTIEPGLKVTFISNGTKWIKMDNIISAGIGTKIDEYGNVNLDLDWLKIWINQYFLSLDGGTVNGTVTANAFIEK